MCEFFFNSTWVDNTQWWDPGVNTSFENMGLVFLLSKIQGRKKSNSSQRLFFCIVPRSDSPNWSVGRGKDLLWSVGNVNTLSDLRHCPDVPYVNISKYRLRLRSHVAQHTYIYFVCTQTHTRQGHQMLLMALTFALEALCLTFALWIPWRVKGFTVWLLTQLPKHIVYYRDSHSLRPPCQFRGSLADLEKPTGALNEGGKAGNFLWAQRYHLSHHICIHIEY